jgi:hypothetical protein
VDRMDYAGCSGGIVSINVNGEHGAYFRIFKGLRQENPLSTLLFNLDAAKEKGTIIGLVPHLVGGGVTHLQYADDTVVLVQSNKESILNLKLIFYCFESMSINYHKSDVYVIGTVRARKEEIAAEI